MCEDPLLLEVSQADSITLVFLCLACVGPLLTSASYFLGNELLANRLSSGAHEFSFTFCEKTDCWASNPQIFGFSRSGMGPENLSF